MDWLKKMMGGANKMMMKSTLGMFGGVKGAIEKLGGLFLGLEPQAIDAFKKKQDEILAQTPEANGISYCINRVEHPQDPKKTRLLITLHARKTVKNQIVLSGALEKYKLNEFLELLTNGINEDSLDGEPNEGNDQDQV